MASRYVTTATVLVCLWLAPLWALAGGDSLAEAYNAILRGDFEAGRSVVSRLLQDSSSARVRETHDWLEAYHEVVSSRQDLKQKSFEWNVAQARKAMEQDKLFAAITFADRAAPYATDRDAFVQSDWVRELARKCQSAASDHAKAGNWSNALRYYATLDRVYRDTHEFEELREDATRHARIELIYDDEEALEEHIDGVHRGMLTKALQLINYLYFEEPDFKKAAQGAIENLRTVCHSKTLQDYLDGLANPQTREYFLENLKDYEAEVHRSSSFTHQDLLRLFNQISSLNKISIQVPAGLLVVEFLEGANFELDDYTSVIWPAEARDFDKIMMGGFEGVGIQLGLDEMTNRLKVITPLEDSPALEAGLQPDDIIIAVDGASTKGWTTEDAVKNIMGPAGSKVVLTILRPRTGEEIPFELIRRNIVLTSVRGVNRAPTDSDAWNYMLDDEAGVAYVRLTNFLPSSHRELDRALRDARRQGMQALILDLRHNPGGLLDVAVDVVSNFLEGGEVVSTRGRKEYDVREPVSGKARYANLPLVVLVNEGSASASEILAGALQDYGRAIVLGDRTFGKGSVQHIRTLPDSARLKLTTALYYLPSGRSPHKRPDAKTWGVSPDWELKLTPKEFRRVIEMERESYIIHNEGDSKELTEEEREKRLAKLKDDDEEDEDSEPELLTEDDIQWIESDPYEAPKTDPQLETALLLLRVKLAGNMPWPSGLASAHKVQTER